MPSFLKILLYYLIAISSFFYSAHLLAVESDWSNEDYSKVRIISAQTHIGKNTEVLLGLHFKLEPGWKIYWRFPGDSGMPPELNIEDSLNINSLKIFWPFPEQIKEQENIITRGYYNEVILPIKVQLKSNINPLVLNASLSYQVCKDICIPISTKLSFLLLNGNPKLSVYAQIIDKYMAKVPKSPESLGITSTKLSYTNPGSIFVGIKGLSSIEGYEGRALAFINGPSNFSFVSKEKFYKLKDNLFTVEVEIRPEKVEELLDYGGFLDIVVGIEETYIEWRQYTKDIKQINTDLSFLIVIFFSFLGGFILNFMPCVLPVLSLKLTSIISNLPTDYKNIRRSFIYTSIGIICSFIILGVGAILIRNTGVAVGWGMQFQSPGFILFLILATTIFSLNLFDIFQFGVPNFVSSGFGSLKLKTQSALNSFFLGFLATLLATPCTAPFVGTAIAYALSHSYKEILIIFIMMGVGMSLPYFVFMVFPSLVSFLPRPGPWIIKFKRILGFLLLATALWLGNILYELLSRSENYTSNDDWEALNLESIDQYITDNKIVFVDITADWCVTCLINKKLVLDSEKFISYVKSEQVILMRGDWTKPSNEIDKYLNKLNRYGIPLNVIHGKLRKEGQILSTILTLKNVIRSIENIKSSK